MKISIIIPCYNGSDFIASTLKSVQMQTYQNWECVIIDDGSKDNSKVVIQNFIKSDARFIYKHQENKGLSGARNTGIKNATGEFIYFLDADDLISPDALENLYALIDPDIDIVFGKTAITNGQNFTALDYLDHKPVCLKKLNNCNKELIPLVLEKNLICTAHNRLYRISFLQKNKLIFKPGLLHEDELWFFETLFLSNYVVLNNKATYFYNTTNGESIINNLSDKNVNAYLEIITEIYNKYYLNHQYAKSQNEISAYITHLKTLCIGIYKKLSIKDKQKISNSIEHVFLTIQPIRTKIILSKKQERRLYKFYIASFLNPDEIVRYQNKPKGFINKIIRKILFYKTYIKNYKTIQRNYNI